MRTRTRGRATRAAARSRSPAPAPEQIQKRAYELYEARGGGPGRELEDWLLAEHELRTQSDRREGKAK